MNIIERGESFLQFLLGLASRTAWDWCQCPKCGGRWTSKWGFYPRNPWFLSRQKQMKAQRHMCYACNSTYSTIGAS